MYISLLTELNYLYRAVAINMSPLRGFLVTFR